MFFIVDDHGELVGKYKTHDEAQRALDALVEEDPLAVDDCAIVEIDERTGRRAQASTHHAVSA